MQISVIIPTYKPQDYLYECLDSLCRQTMDTSLWEVIVVLNGCDNPWHNQLKEYATAHPRIQLHVIQTNKPGVSNARNIGLEYAQGEYITFIDDDDYISDTYLASLYPLASPTTVAASYTFAFDNTHAHITPPYYIEKEYLRWIQQNHILPYYQPRRYMNGACMKLIHRSIIGETRFDDRFKNGEDSLFMFAISNRMQYIHFSNQDAIYFRRIRQESASQNMSMGETICNRLALIKEYTRIYIHGTHYSFRFYLTRVIGSLNTILRIWI